MSQPPVFKKELHQQRPNAKATAPAAKPAKRENTFSKSRDVREDRGARQMKNSHAAQTLPHAK